MEHPLPLPRWGTEAPPPLRCTSVTHYEELAGRIELILQQLVLQHPYNTVGNFLRFYSEFQSTGGKDLGLFYKSYCPPISVKHHTCVGLGLELILHLREMGIHNAYLTSCEEHLEDIASYSSGIPPQSAEKEHVVVVCHVEVAGRPGFLLLDPGYHVARVITAMEDGKYPHTGWFTQTDTAKCRKEYMYVAYSNSRYILWTVKEMRGGNLRMSHNLIYVERPLLTPVQSAERRNLLYDFKSLLSRDAKGHLQAGLYFPLRVPAKQSITVFHHEDNDTAHRCETKIPLAYFGSGSKDQQFEDAIDSCASKLGFETPELQSLLLRIANVLHDDDFVAQVLRLNADIAVMSADN